MAPDRLPPGRDVLLVAAGGSLGALARVGLAEVLPVSPGRVPWTTLLANVVGAFLLALLLTRLAERAIARPEVGLAVGTGAIGAFTTYSTLADELTRRLADDTLLLAVGYGLASLTLGLLAAFAGTVVARRRSDRTPAGGGR